MGGQVESVLEIDSTRRNENCMYPQIRPGFSSMIHLNIECTLALLHAISELERLGLYSLIKIMKINYTDVFHISIPCPKHKFREEILAFCCMVQE